MTVGLVLVSHSAKLAEGLAEVAAQMAPEVPIVPAGGLAEGGIGTDYDQVVAAIGQADRGDGVVLLYDLGSAQMTAELAVESLPEAETVAVADGPFVEGTVAAAVAAQGGASRADVVAAAVAAGSPDQAAPTATRGADVDKLELVLHNEVGLHARPAAVLARTLSGIEAEVSVALGDQEADAHSVLALMSLGARKGDRIEVRARGAQAAHALDAVQQLVETDFGES
ncbi:dihydroxyacetone kinase phosphoryl donor subunit DhaM [Amycolatopsis alkalitolerans]|uniref:Phosphocarrier protein HPr n=1 Tax=Amycolatopsis alkalitolerans TaxID=2547244 RepID=A0A5C4LW32_9PSEU|nr:dihydroxyacetone kinase phosphoryl donor subunit DhaM [Amycolatopsis alkalitolerans]TNC22129.1 HPr family phosphocarrier protein [Amycolatopsis alkalitolerans]